MQRYWSANRTFILILMLGCFAGLAAETPKESSAEVDYNLQVVKFYFQKQEYQTVINYIYELEKVNYITDSLKYYLGESYLGLEYWQPAADLFSDLLKHSIDIDLGEFLLPDFRHAISKLTVAQQIEQISGILNEQYTFYHRISLLFILAEIYEEARIFEEANDVYRTILAEVNIKEQLSVDLKIAANLIFLKEYIKALELLKPIISLQDSLLNKDALFLSYVANFSLPDTVSAKADLIELYSIYPKHPSRFEIIQALSDIFLQEKQYITSWYLLEELKSLCDPAQLFAVESKIKELKQKMALESDLPAQFDNIKPIFRKIEE